MSGYQRITYDPQFKPVRNIYEDRLRQFISKGGDYADLNLPRFYDKERISLDQKHVNVSWYQVPFEEGSNPVSPDKRPSWSSVIEGERKGKLEFKKAHIGQPFGPSWSTTWFKVELRVPSKWVHSGEQLIFEWNCNNEGVVIDPDTLLPATAFSGGERKEYLLPKSNSGEYCFFIEAGNNGMFGCGDGSDINPPDNNRFFHLDSADLVWPDKEARALYIDFWMLGDAARELPDDTWQKQRARQVANEVMDMFDYRDRASVKKCREFLKEAYFDQFLDSPEVYYKGDSQQITSVYSIGNCHIDTAWLWPFAETKRKIVRSWASQCTLMDEYPEYQFAASQAQQFKWLLKYHPDFFNKVLIPKVQQSQFIPVGGSWVENDTNIPCGESLARQFLYGQRFYLRHFGCKSDIFWLPDTFGYSSQVPQICQLSGIDKFVTQKLSWNNINSFPHSTFNWAGLDGSQLLTHMPPGNTYTADSHFGDVLRTAKQNKTSEAYPSGLMMYGKGDGGGGPTREMLEKMRRIRSMSNKNGNVIPKLNVGKSVDDFYADILAKTDNGCKLPTWEGELYFEFHRGTYTTHAELKKLMRFSEIAIHDLEWLATKASVLFPKHCKYPINEINELWEDVLLCQFHDVLPGTCIEMVYKYEAVPMLKEVLKKCALLQAEVLKALNKVGTTDNNTYITTLPWAYPELTLQNTRGHEARIGEDKDSYVLSNSKLQVTICKETGVIVSVLDVLTNAEYIDIKNGRNKAGANQFVLFDDKPLSWQAWDTELYSVNQYKNVTNVKNIKVKSNDAKCCSIEVVFSISDDCEVTTEISLNAVSAESRELSRVDITTNVTNWNLRNQFLKVEFPVNVRSEYASYETQFGVTRRPTHYNTSWDVAKFEVCCHKFADYSDFSKGVSILNDSKYGFSTHGNLMRLSLLRSSKAPDAHADMGSHTIKYAIYPHRNGLSAKTVRSAHDFNLAHRYKVPMAVATKFDHLLSISGDENVILSNIKRGEDDKALNSEYSLKPREETSIIVRVYESLGGEAHATLKLNLPLHKVLKVDNLESKVLVPLEVSKEGLVPIHLRPFEIATYKFIF
ncbi:alpha-mannosidase KNAG_0I00600 [Huiozyma naganishii CBS 8797]|uniref:Alpha-mannosidase n=1 Tax=Huiozyma naganishii (strain ATCC MYA-139 / BCRC 22969 / CBS 8797 / KCTC 17520 / NBRC 10181 / NCYC 3082 / Yp74L-3) TaxID=1071383 RepID=J7SA15_HUIN7|nr:hypothetical protein KNAG_0I00600 [Kazachstania naganishii CBS 8797]CCK71851.1 hypothetical protein KNAG_0I00600 [Kazachstania naganishii CBS 8797]